MHRAPSPTKRKERSEDKPKERGKEKSGTKEGAEKDRGRDKTRKRRSASTGSSSSRLGEDAFFSSHIFLMTTLLLHLFPRESEFLHDIGVTKTVLDYQYIR